MKIDKEILINTLVDMRLKQMSSVKTCLEYLASLGYKQTYSYVLLKEAKTKIKEYYADSHIDSLEESIGQMEELAADAKKKGQYKLAFEVRKELNNILGLGKTSKIEIDANIKTEIKIVFPKDEPNLGD
jgi:Ser-tRNA(Ala) deacylase AlaX